MNFIFKRRLADSAARGQATLLRSGRFGNVVGAAVHGWEGEILGGGCQHIAVLRLLAGVARGESIIKC